MQFADLAGDRVALEMAEAVLSGDDDVVGHAEEESVLDDAAAGVEFGGEFFGFGDGAEGAVVDVVAFVGGVRRSVRLGAEFGMTAKVVEEVPLAGAAEGDDFDG